MENEMNAEEETFISKHHQLAMVLDDDIISVEKRLTKGDAPPPPVQQLCNSDEVSDITGNTRESKAKLYAEKAVKEVASQYSETIALKDTDLGVKDDKLQNLKQS